MHALRLHKVTVPGRDKARQARKLQQATRQRAARSSILQGLRTFFTADSFMYGPLMESPSPTAVHISSTEDSEIRTPDKDMQSDGGLDDGSTRDDSNGAEENEETNEENGSKKVDNGHGESAIGRYQLGSGGRGSKTVVSVQRTSARTTARTVVPLPHDGSRTPSSTGRVMKPSRNGT